MNDTTQKARDLRQNQTDAEKLLWKHLRNRQLDHCKFRRQHPIPPYVADFFCEEKSLIVELDGGQHTEETDKKRTEALQTQGYNIIRFWNNDVLSNIEGVLIKISEALSSTTQKPLTPTLSPGEREQKRICLGKISDVHGIKGLVKILPFGEDMSLLEGELFTGETGDQTISITLKNPQGKYMLASVEGVADRNASEAIKGTELWINRDQLPEPEDGEYYIEDLVGLAAIDENGETIGTILSVQNFGAGDLLEIKPTSGHSYFLPFNDETVPNIDLDAKLVTVIEPEMSE